MTNTREVEIIYGKHFWLLQINIDILKDIKDPEKPHTLEELEVLDEDSIEFKEFKNYSLITILWKPTAPNCSLALNIGLSIREKLKEELPSLFPKSKYQKLKVDIYVKKGYHLQEEESNYKT
jgi:metal-sulfur cluster biosynthetic enzyme